MDRRGALLGGERGVLHRTRDRVSDATEIGDTEEMAAHRLATVITRSPYRFSLAIIARSRQP